MRSGGNVSTMSNNTSKSKSMDDDDDDGDPKTTQTSKCKGATTIPIFLKSKCQVFKKREAMNAHETRIIVLKSTQHAIGVASFVLVVFLMRMLPQYSSTRVSMRHCILC
jgi:hypothetical protein